MKGRYYEGQGRPSRAQLPDVDRSREAGGEGYRADDALATAVDVAITLGMPLLLTGEPGAGKSGLARSLAWEHGLGEPELYVVKSDTAGRDLFYTFDTVGRFRNRDEAVPDLRFVTFNALGRAILFANDEAIIFDMLGVADEPEQQRIVRALLGLHGGDDQDGARVPRRSVVLIDEIDKAPRDVPNDLLVEIESFEFTMPELPAVEGRPVTVRLPREAAGSDRPVTRNRPLVVITSNQESALPEPFLRRCVFHHLEHPAFEADLEGAESERTITVERIVAARIDEERAAGGLSAFAQDCIGTYRALRADPSQPGRRPSVAELLGWMRYLGALAPGRPRLSALLREAPDELLRSARVTLAKGRDDQDWLTLERLESAVKEGSR